MFVREALAFSETVNLRPPPQFQNLMNLTFSGVVSIAINVVLVLAALLFFFLLVLGGIKWITSGGNKAQTEAARGQISAAFIGLLIVFAAWAVLQIIGTIFNVDLLRDFTIGLNGGGGGGGGGGGVRVILNAASGRTCGTVCSSNGLRCAGVGWDTGGTNGQAINAPGGICDLTPISATCGTSMPSQGATCRNNRARWTNCRCN